MIKITYFDFNFWRLDILRLCLSYSKTPYVYEKISRENFIKKKKDGDFPFGQLPVITINNRMHGQTSSLAKYCARKSNLYDSNIENSLVIDQVLDWAKDITLKIAPSIREKNRQKQLKLRKSFIKNDLKNWFAFLEKLFLNSSEKRVFFTDNFSVADFTAWRVIYWFWSGKLELINNDFLKEFPHLNNFFQTICSFEPLSKLNEFKEITSKKYRKKIKST